MNTEDYEKLSESEAEDFLAQKLREGDREEIGRYMSYTIKHPYLCQNAAPKNTLSEEDFVYFYYAAVAAEEINTLKTYYAALLQNVNALTGRIGCEYSKYNAARRFKELAEGVKAAAPERWEDLKPLIFKASFSGWVGKDQYLKHVPGKDTYKVDTALYIRNLIKAAEEAAYLISTGKAANEAAKDSIEALGIEYLITDGIKARIELTPTYLDSLAIEIEAAKNSINEEDATPEDLKDLMEAVKGIKSYALSDKDEEAYRVNLFDFAVGTNYLLVKVADYKATHPAKPLHGVRAKITK